MPVSIADLSATKKAAVIVAIQRGEDIGVVAQKFDVTVTSISAMCARMRRRGWEIRYAKHRTRAAATQDLEQVEKILAEAGLRKHEGPFFVRPLKAHQRS